MAVFKFSSLRVTPRKYYRFLRRLFTRAISEQLSAHHIAMGFALGTAFALGPSFGFQIIPFLAIAFKFNYSKLAGLLMIFVSNPLTFVPIYVFELIIGDKLMGSLLTVNVREFRKALLEFVTDFNYQELWALGGDTVLAFLVGSLFCAFVSGIGVYFFTKPLIIRWQRRTVKGKWWRKRRQRST